MTDNIDARIPVAELRNRLSDIISRIEATQERFGVTKHGHDPTVVLMAVEDLRSILETVDALTNLTRREWQQLALAEEDLKAGRVVTLEEAMAEFRKRYPWLKQ